MSANTMNIIKYESHVHFPPEFPILFHSGSIASDGVVDGSRPVAHWHEGIEIILALEGEMEIHCNENRMLLKQGNIAVMNSNRLHVVGTSGFCKFHCLITDLPILTGAGFPVETTWLEDHFSGESFRGIFSSIDKEMTQKRPYYKSAVRGMVTELFAHLYRSHSAAASLNDDRKQSGRLTLTRDAIGFIHEHCCEDIDIDDISAHLGFSKYYVCHVFKEITGRTLVDYINLLRCINARNLLISGEYNIGESAAQSGFRNLSYFSKTYKRLMGELPSGHAKTIPKQI
jgi:AraC-type DNA-binding domain-containing proteins